MACPSLLSDDDVRRFRTKPCQRSICEFGVDRCQYSHCTAWVRRCPFYLAHASCLRYVPMVCPDVRLRQVEDPKWRTVGSVDCNRCSRGGYCPFAHSLEELYYHPLVYKTKPCAYFVNGTCKTYYCPDIHGTAERRCVENRVLYLPFVAEELRPSVSTAFPHVIFTATIPKQRPLSGGGNTTACSSRATSPLDNNNNNNSKNQRKVASNRHLVVPQNGSRFNSQQLDAQQCVEGAGGAAGGLPQDDDDKNDNYHRPPTALDHRRTCSNSPVSQHHQHHPHHRFALSDFPITPEETDAAAAAAASVVLKSVSKSLDRFFNSNSGSNESVLQQFLSGSPSMWGSDNNNPPSPTTADNFCWAAGLPEPPLSASSSPNWPVVASPGHHHLNTVTVPSVLPSVTVTDATGEESRRIVVGATEPASSLGSRLRLLADRVVLASTRIGNDEKFREITMQAEKLCAELETFLK